MAAVLCVVANFTGGTALSASASGRGTDSTLGYQRGIIQNADNGMCLDSNYNGDVYVLPCTANNRFQLWDIWNGGWTKNVQTGLCLTRDVNYRMETYDCLEARSEYWTHWHGGWYQNQLPDWDGSLQCASSSGQGGWPSLGAFDCYDLRNQFWWVW